MGAEYFVVCDEARESVRLGKGRWNILSEGALSEWPALTDDECTAHVARCLPGVDVELVGALTTAIQRWCISMAWRVRVVSDADDAYATMRDYRVAFSRYALPT